MKEYITKLIDRNLQRKRESGITNYALYSILIVLIYKILEGFPKIPFSNDFLNVSMIIGLSFNLFLLIFIICATIDFKKKKQNDLKVYYKDKVATSEIFIFSLGILAPAIFNFINTYQSFNKYDNNLHFYFLLLSINYIILLIALIGVSFSNKEGNLDVKGENNYGKFFVFFTYSFLLLEICLSIYYLYTYKSLSVRKFDVFLFALYLFGIHVIVDKIIEASNNDNLIKSLEDLEYEIYIKGLDDDEIRNKLQSNYFGFLFQDWIEIKYQELKVYEEYYQDCVMKIQSEKDDLETIDCIKYSIECEGRRNRINDNKITLKKDTLNFYDDKIKQIQNVLDLNKLKRESEIDLVKNLLANYKLSKEKHSS